MASPSLPLRGEWPRPLRRCCCCIALRTGCLCATAAYACLDLACICTTVLAPHRLQYARAVFLFSANMGWRFTAHIIGLVAGYKQNKYFFRAYFYAWIVLLVWLPWDTFMFYLKMENDSRFYASTYSGSAAMQADYVLLALRAGAAALGPYMLLLTFSVSENIQLMRGHLNKESGCAKTSTDITPVGQAGTELSALEWLRQTDPKLVRSRRKTGT